MRILKASYLTNSTRSTHVIVHICKYIYIYIYIYTYIGGRHWIRILEMLSRSLKIQQCGYHGMNIG